LTDSTIHPVPPLDPEQYSRWLEANLMVLSEAIDDWRATGPLSRNDIRLPGVGLICRLSGEIRSILRDAADRRETLFQQSLDADILDRGGVGRPLEDPSPEDQVLEELFQDTYDSSRESGESSDVLSDGHLDPEDP
jgi:hypothetical protein